MFRLWLGGILDETSCKRNCLEFAEISGKMSRSIPKIKPENLSAASAVRGPRSRIIGEGEMPELVRGYDWAKTSLGAVETWPDTLVTTVNMLLASRHPMFLWWGPELIQFYNDGYRPSIRGDKHPSALGQRGMECWPEIWEIIGPQIDGVMTRGESTWNINQLVPINRNGKPEEVYWTYGYSPVRGKDGEIQGTLVVCSETTEPVLSERRLRTLLAIGAELQEEHRAPGSQPLLSFAQELIGNCNGDPADIPFAMLYLLTDDEVIQAGSTASCGAAADPTNWPLREAAHSQTAILLENLRERFRDMVCPPWPEPVTSAYVLPLRMPGAAMQAVLVSGISPRLPFDYRYRTFFELVGTRMIGLLQSETHGQELAQAAKRFKDLSQADPFGMLIGGLDGEVRYVNPAFLKTLGYTEAEVNSGKVRWDSLTPPEYAAGDAKAVEQLRQFGRCDVYEKVYLTKDGRRIPILLGASVIGDSAGQPEVAAFITDLTTLKAAQEALRKANEELEMKVSERTAELKAEVADRQRAEKSLRELTGRLLRTQDEERRHMARELHDHAGQTLAALAMNLSGLQRAAQGNDPKILRLAAESQQLSEDLSTEIRTLSYLLHPPLLDEAGLTSAIRWYVDGFSQRSKIKVEVEIPADLGRLPRELELVIFRVVQESLTNIHRHSGSATAKIVLSQTERAVKFEIGDRGKGISAEKQQEMTAVKAGVGVRGMEERVRQFDGTLEIVSDQSGTTVVGMLPVKLMGGE
jgi:PAS domain S-box-containing protein